MRRQHNRKLVERLFDVSQRRKQRDIWIYIKYLLSPTSQYLLEHWPLYCGTQFDHIVTEDPRMMARYVELVNPDNMIEILRLQIKFKALRLLIG